MVSKPWFRLYHDLADDPKVMRLKPAAFRSWIVLLCLACRNDGRLPPVEDIAFTLRTDEDAVERIIAELMLAGLIDEIDGILRPHNWDGRQYQSDVDKTAAERKRRQRQRDREAADTRDTDRDTNRDVERDMNLDDTRTEQTRADTDPEAERITSQGRAEGLRVSSTREGPAKLQAWEMRAPFKGAA
jgi:hypothetical protein